MNSRFFFSSQTLLAVILCPFLLIAGERIQFNQQKMFNATQYQFTSQFFKFITIGFWPAAVDGLWISTIQNASTTSKSTELIEETSHFYELATDLDPNFYELYDQAGILYSVLFEEPDAAIHFLKKGIQTYLEKKPPAKFWTHPYTLFIYLAYVQAYQKNDWSEAKKSFLAASMVPGAPQYLMQMREWLNKENSEKILAQRILKILIQNAQDEKVKQKYEEKLKQYE